MRQSACLNLLLLVLSTAVVAVAQEPLKDPPYYLERLLEYYKGIRTISAEYVITGKESSNDVKNDADIACRYFRKGDYQREEMTRPGTHRPTRPLDETTVYDGVTIRKLSTDEMHIGPDMNGLMARSTRSSQIFFRCREELERWFAEPEQLNSRKMTVEYCTEADGRQTVQVIVEPGEGTSMRRVYRLDPSLRFAPVFCALGDHLLYEVKRFADAGNGYAAPAEVLISSYSQLPDRMVQQKETVRVSKVEINGPVDNSVFELMPPAGMPVRDNMAGLRYTAGGPSEGAAKPLAEAEAAPRPAKQTAAALTARQGAPSPTPVVTPAVPKSVGYIVTAFLVVVFGGVVAWQFRKRKDLNPPPRI